ncbi:alpha/beta hydrolase [Altibacter lentus]|uniref:alpha/beta hydrolase n=1 Tax=Altibacter lentus TaxID=1223410 RepID=UPI00055941B5|nr:alpha/beta hydrolase [Altibacter lentus]
MNKLIIVFALLIFGNTFSQEINYISEEISIPPLVEGTLLLPETSSPIPLVILLGGSGPVDRNGNQGLSKNNSLRFLAEGLYANNIATFRYDKRLVKIMKMGAMDEKKIRFAHFIEDAVSVLTHFKNDARFSSIVIAGHSQGSLVGMIAAQSGADGFISLAGAGQEIDDVIVDQIAKQNPALKDNARTSFDDLRVNGVATNYSPLLASIFRPAIQPFIFDWMQYDPQEEIAKLDIPVLIVNGDKDIQVQVSEAEKLHAAKPSAQLVILPKMNHIFKKIEGDDLENQKSYNEFNRPVMPELIEIVSNFVKQ